MKATIKLNTQQIKVLKYICKLSETCYDTMICDDYQLIDKSETLYLEHPGCTNHLQCEVITRLHDLKSTLIESLYTSLINDRDTRNALSEAYETAEDDDFFVTYEAITNLINIEEVSL